MRNLAARLAAREVGTLVLVSPHSPRRPRAFGIWDGARLSGSLARFGAPEAAVDLANDREFASGLTGSLTSLGVSSWRIPEGELDHGAVVPLWFLVEAGWRGPTVVLSLRDPEEGGWEELGRAIRDTAARLGRRVAVIASGDMSHRLAPGAPAGYHPRAAGFDCAVIEALRAADDGALRDFDPGWQEVAGEDALDSIRVGLAAADWRSGGREVLGYEGPFGVGYGVAVLFDASGSGEGDGARFEGELPLPAVARRSVHEALVSPSRDGGPPAAIRAGRRGAVFVTLRTVDGALRGCVGSTSPTCEDLAEETWHYARVAAFRDPRFAPVTLDELERLRFEVSVLHSFEPVRAVLDLDPGRFGVIVSAEDGRRGLLLPAIPQIGSVEEQLGHARRKAGIGPGEPVRIERFRVEKFAEGETRDSLPSPWSPN